MNDTTTVSGWRGGGWVVGLVGGGLWGGGGTG